MIQKDAYEKELPYNSYYPDKMVRHKGDYFDFIAYDFLYKTLPQPDLFELRKVGAEKNLEKRHGLMLSIIDDRTKNAERYKQERFSKLGKYAYDIGFNNWPNDRLPDKDRRYTRADWYHMQYLTERKKMKGCQHRIK